jgi:hypothetical protein
MLRDETKKKKTIKRKSEITQVNLVNSRPEITP